MTRVNNEIHHWVAQGNHMHGRIQRGPESPGHTSNLQEPIGFLKNTGMGLPREAIEPLESNCFSREVRTALCEIH